MVTLIQSWPVMFEEHPIKATVSPFNLQPKECFDILEIAETLLPNFCPPEQSTCLNRNNLSLLLMNHL